MSPLRYLLVTHIPFAREGHAVVTDGLWARDLAGLRESVGPIRVVAPELGSATALNTWGPAAGKILPAEGIDFAGLPAFAGRRDLWKWPSARRVLRRQVEWAELVHTSNFFPPYEGLYYAHNFAVRSGRKTLFVIAEDFFDMLGWEWVRLSGSALDRWRRRRMLAAMDGRVRRAAATAGLTMIHTPAAVWRYRLAARNSIAIRQPGHEECDVISESSMEAKCADILRGAPLVLVAACRHKPLKGLDLLIAAISLVKQRGIDVEARIYGEGPSTSALQSMVCRLNVADRVDFPGALAPGAQVYRAIAEGHLFAMPHRTTDFGRAFFDAMAGGTPVIAFETPASAQTVRHQIDGLLAAPDDIEALAAAIERFHFDRGLLACCARASRHRALLNTRRAWFELRAGWIRELLERDN